MKKLKLYLSTLLWIPALVLVEIPAYLVGLVLVPILAYFERQTAVVYESPYVNLWIDGWRYRWAWLWGNDEDGIGGPETIGPNTSPSLRRWIERMAGKSYRARIVSWSAFRNPAANLRFSRYGVRLRRDEMRWIGNSDDPWEDYKRDLGVEGVVPRRSYWILARQGVRSGLWYIRPRRNDPTAYSIVRLGWKVRPFWYRPIDRYAGFSVQFGLKRRADFREVEP